MAKNFNEIDVLELIKTLWEEKVKIFLITIFSILVAIAYFYLTPNVYNSSIKIKASKNSEFIKFQNISNFLSNQKKKSLVLSGSSEDITEQYLTIDQPNNFIISNETILTNFMEELMDYEEFISVIKNYKKIEEEISDFPDTDQHEELLYFIKSFTSEKKSRTSHNINFKWNDDRQSIEVIDKTLKLTLINFKNLFFKELEDLVDEKKKILIAEDFKRINYLTEQSLIAKELNIVENQLQNNNLLQNSADSYYLRGYKAIDKEISLIKKREYQDFTDIKSDINNLKKANFNWVQYNIFLINTYSDKNLIRILIISILIGLIFGGSYVLIYDLFKFRKKKKIK